MSIPFGARFGPYEVLSPLGVGGMGEVYLANDTRLDRQVAIKALPEHLAADPDRLGRFEREARTLASLNHPNVAGIYGVEEQDGRKYLVLEYVEGETLAERLDRGALPVDEALEVCTQIAAGVEAAHEAGVIHRDLKPANVKITPDGKVKVLDFGLAKMAEGASSSGFHEAETVTSPAHRQHSPTMPGVILGTAAYMSPEQARGRAIDKRTDIWSFGVVLYEMLTGTSPFHGETVSDSIGAVLHKNLDLDRLPPQTPTNIRRVLERCLVRDRNFRFRDIGDVRLELAASDRVVPVQRTTTLSRPIRGVSVVAFILGIGLGLATWQWLLPFESGGMSSVRRASMNFPSDFAVYNLTAPIAISPDGSTMVFAAIVDGGERRLYLRRLDSFENVPLAGTEDAEDPFFSPDGKWIGFSSNSKLRRMPLAGGRPVEICPGMAMGAHWTEDGDIIFGTFGGGLSRVSASGGTPVQLTTLDRRAGEISHAYPHLMPDGDTVVFTVATGEGSRLDTLSLKTGERAVLVHSGSAFTHLFEDVVAFAVTGELQIARLDPRRRTTLETVVPILDGISWESIGGAESAGYAVGRDGTLVYSSGDISRRTSSVVVVDDQGVPTPIDLPQGDFLHPEISPDGRSIAICKIDWNTGTGDIWVVDIERDTVSRLTSQGANYTPIWTPDGKHVTFVSNGNIVSIPADGSGEPDVLFVGDSYERPLSWAPDGESLVFSAGEQLVSQDLMLLRSDGTAQPLLQTTFDERQATISPDGRMIAYISNETGRHEVYIRTFPEMAGKLLVSESGGAEPRWSSDGALFYRSGDQVLRVRVMNEPSVSVSKPDILFEAQFHKQIVRNFDVFPEADRFIMVSRPDLDSLQEFRVVYNWFNEVRNALQRAEN